MTNLLAIVAQIFGDFFMLKKVITFSVKTVVATFWETIAKFGLVFIPTSGHTESLRHVVVVST